MPAFAQQFIGCRLDSSWAETPLLKKNLFLNNLDFQSTTATLIITSLGYHEVYVNGQLVGDHILEPAVSQLDKHSLSVSYDVSPYLRNGDNEILLWLGQGWGRIYKTPALAKAILIHKNTDFQDTLLVTDTSWQASPSAYSYTGSWQPLQFGGERFDAGWTASWRNASSTQDYPTISTPQEFLGNRIVDTLTPENIFLQPDGRILIDFNHAITGWLSINFNNPPKGKVITIEYLDHPDAVPPHTEQDIYIARGNGEEIFRNRFHLHAFRYVRITGLSVLPASGQSDNPAAPIPSHPDIRQVHAFQISAVPPNGGATFECSDQRLNAVHNLIKRTLSCLTFSGYMVDCPHLERMGYGGDGNSSTMTLQTIWDVRDTYSNWLTAWSDAIDSSGSLPYVAPAFPTGGGPYWSGFIIKAPWRTYINYGDRLLIDRHYNDMKRWLSYVERYSPDGLLQPWPDDNRMWFLGDWLAPSGIDVGGKSAIFVSNCFISECLSDMEQMAILTGHKDDAKHFADWRKRLLKKIHQTYYHPQSHTYANGTPIDMAYSLLAGIVPDSKTRKAVEEKMLYDCHTKYRDHIAVGLMGVPIFTQWAIDNRHTDLMATILRQPDYPGYLHMIDHGATTTWESWDCGQEGKEDRSRIHNCYNGVAIWFYQALAGIRPDPSDPGYRHFFIDPQPCQGVTWLRASKPTIYGDIRVEINGNRMKLTVPTGTSATIFPNTKHERLLLPGNWELEIKQP